ncbi:MAG: UDP-N-acetylenolpyruvoylglucosamine reductase, partial [Ellagibacter isourolithinifaciens]|nr:UDP-N-acetylenolpyruvoylglucosamine reductase [Ellagibacter isourolithinifaciens]
DATSADVQALIAEVQRRVLESSGVALEPEVRMWGREA